MVARVPENEMFGTISLLIEIQIVHRNRGSKNFIAFIYPLPSLCLFSFEIYYLITVGPQNMH